MLVPSVALPTAAAAVLVGTAVTGASVAQSAPLRLDLTAVQEESARAQAADDIAARADLTQRRQAVVLERAADEGRATEQARIARDKARKATAERKAAAAKAKADAAAKAKALREGKRWIMPIKGAHKTSGFGQRWGRLHAGNDFGCSVGQPLMAMSKGTVTYAGQMSGYGNIVKIEYWDGTESYFGHMNAIGATVGDEVLPGDVVGQCGNTGRSTGPHLHLEIHPSGGGPVDPTPWLIEKGLL